MNVHGLIGPTFECFCSKCGTGEVTPGPAIRSDVPGGFRLCLVETGEKPAPGEDASGVWTLLCEGCTMELMGEHPGFQNP